MTPEELTPYFVIAVFYGVFFCVGWVIAIFTRWSKILTFLVLLVVVYVFWQGKIYKIDWQIIFRHPFFYGLLGLAWGYFRNP